MTDLSEIVQQAQCGNSEAYEQIVRRFQDMAVGYAYSMLGDMHHAEDTAQDAFIAAYYALPGLRTPAAFPGWFRRIVLTQANRRLRTKRPVLVSLEQVAETASPIPEPTEYVEQHERNDWIQKALSILSDEHRSIIMLYYMGDYSQKEIAAFLEIPLGTVKTRLYHAKKHLKKRMMTLMESSLQSKRPSNDERFTQQVMQLFEATKAGNLDQVKALLTKDQSLAQARTAIQTPLWGAHTSALHLAVMHGRKDIVDLLLANGADINERDPKFFFSALHHAIDLADFLPEYAELNMVDFLLERGAEKDVWACWWLGDTESVKAWLDEKPELVNTIGPGPGLLLSFVGTIKAAQFLLDYGANPLKTYETPNAGETTPLRNMIYHSMFMSKEQALYHHLLDHAGIELDIFLACALGEVDRVKAVVTADKSLVNSHIGSDYILEEGLTPLHLAAVTGRVEIVEFLLNNGADINATASSCGGVTPLIYTIWRGPRELFDPLPNQEQLLQGVGVYHLLTQMPRLLLENGADVNARDSTHNKTVLDWALTNFEDETDRENVLELLRAFGAEG